MAVEPSSSGGSAAPGRLARAIAWSKSTARQTEQRATRARTSHVSVDMGFRTAERQRRVAAMVLAGGIAYRILFWLLAVSVVIGGVLGLFDPDAMQSALTHFGVVGWEAAAIASFTQSADGNEWWLLLVGGWLVLWTGYTCNKTLSLAHATIWQVDAPRVDNPLRSSLRFTGFTFGFILAMAGARWVREQDVLGGLAVTMLIFGVAFGIWLVASRALPNAAAGWIDLVPGAALVAVGLQAMHVFTVYFLGPKLESATQLYGVVGVVTTLLFWFYLGGRLIVMSATINAEFAEQRSARRAVPDHLLPPGDQGDPDV